MLGDRNDVHANINCLVGFTPVLEAVYSGHQPPMFSPSIGVVLPEGLLGSGNDCCTSKSRSSCNKFSNTYFPKIYDSILVISFL